MTAPEKDVLLKLLCEIEDLRAHQALTTVVLSSLPALSATNLVELTGPLLEQSRLAYSGLRGEIEDLA
jgi:hypothetical protein